jgi:hypothetical protein
MWNTERRQFLQTANRTRENINHYNSKIFSQKVRNNACVAIGGSLSWSNLIFSFCLFLLDFFSNVTDNELLCV